MLEFVSSTIKSLVITVQSAITSSTPDNCPVETSPDRVGTIIKIALLLRTRIPADIVPLILDHAQLWIPVRTTHSLNPDVDRISEAQSPKLQVALTIPDDVPHGSIRCVRFTIVSRDQGWSDFGADHGTYNGSYTWFEAGVRGLPRDRHDAGQRELEVADRAALMASGDVFCTHRNALDEEHRLQCQPQARFYKFGSKELTRNIHAGRDLAEHVIEWSLDNLDPEIVQTLRELRKGCRIEVAAYAQFQGWVNYVKSVRIDVERVAVRKL